MATDRSARPASHDTAPPRDLLVEQAERMFGVHGIDGVSLRKISAAAGFGNNFAVQYHFGDRDGLIRAIFALRLPQAEALRATLFDAAERAGRLDDPRTLVEILHRPSIELRNAAGERAYASFLLAIHFSPEGFSQRFLGTHAPLALRVMALLAAALPEIPKPVLSERHRSVSLMLVTGATRIPPDGDAALEELLIGDMLDMAAAALAAPSTPALAERLAQGAQQP